MHLTEKSSLLTPDNVVRLHASWHAYWAEGKSICVEKSPSNLLKTRFLQAAFSNSYFIVVKRHPVPVSMATQRWKVTVDPLHRLFDHWLHCHSIFDGDKQYLKHLYELTYEDYIGNPTKYHQEIADFIGSRVPEDAMEDISDAHNKKYFDRWARLVKKSPFRRYYRYLAWHYQPRFAQHNYSLIEWQGVERGRLEKSQISSLAGALYCAGADIGAFARRFWTLLGPSYMKRRLKGFLPQALTARIKQIRQRRSLTERNTRVASR
jgi:hypothetical protein